MDEKEFISVNRLKQREEPVIALQNDTAWHGKFVDASVIFPEYLKTGRRPSFYSIGGARKRYSLNHLKLNPGNFVQAFYANEKPGDRIPADQLVIQHSGNDLFLYPGNYRILIKNVSGRLIRTLRTVIR